MCIFLHFQLLACLISEEFYITLHIFAWLLKNRLLVNCTLPCCIVLTLSTLWIALPTSCLIGAHPPTWRFVFLQTSILCSRKVSYPAICYDICAYFNTTITLYIARSRNIPKKYHWHFCSALISASFPLSQRNHQAIRPNQPFIATSHPSRHEQTSSHVVSFAPHHRFPHESFQTGTRMAPVETELELPDVFHANVNQSSLLAPMTHLLRCRT